MKTLEEAIAFVKGLDDGAIDGRDALRFAAFLPFSRLGEVGAVTEIAEEDWQALPWTEEEILRQLKADVEFGYEKGMDRRAISASCMFCVVEMWCELLENGIKLDREIPDYGVSSFLRVANHYGWNLQ